MTWKVHIIKWPVSVKTLQILVICHWLESLSDAQVLFSMKSSLSLHRQRTSFQTGAGKAKYFHKKVELDLGFTIDFALKL